MPINVTMVIEKSSKKLIKYFNKDANVQVKTDVFDVIKKDNYNQALTYLSDNNIDQSDFEIILHKKAV